MSEQNHLVSPNPNIRVIMYTGFNEAKEPIKFREMFKGNEHQVNHYLSSFSSSMREVIGKRLAVVMSDTVDDKNMPIAVIMNDWISTYMEAAANKQWSDNIQEAIENTPSDMLLETECPIPFF